MPPRIGEGRIQDRPIEKALVHPPSLRGLFPAPNSTLSQIRIAQIPLKCGRATLRSKATFVVWLSSRKDTQPCRIQRAYSPTTPATRRRRRACPIGRAAPFSSTRDPGPAGARPQRPCGRRPSRSCCGSGQCSHEDHLQRSAPAGQVRIKVRRRLALVASLRQPSRILDNAPSRLASPAQPIEHTPSPPRVLLPMRFPTAISAKASKMVRPVSLAAG